MTENIGEIRTPSGETMLRMWRVSVMSGARAVVRHFHICFEIMLVESGEGIYDVGGREYPIREGDIFVLSSNECHSIKLSNDLKIVNIHFEPRYLWGSATDSFSDRHSNICFSHADGFENRIPAESACPLSDIFKSMITELSDKKAEYALMTKSHLDRLLVMLIRDYGYADSGVSVARTHLDSIRRAVTYIDAHLDEKLTLNDIAAAAGNSPTYFSALFRRVNNITLWDYILSKRVDRAVRLLCGDQRLTMLDIALACGFGSTANFNKAFRAHTDMTPSEYKSSMLYAIS